MAFRLEITFSGLCLFVRDTHPDLGEVIHVLMPSSEGHTKHFPRLVHSRDYELPDKPANAPPVKKPDASKIVQNDEKIIELDDFPVIDLAKLLAGSIEPAAGRFDLPEKILNVSKLAKLAGASDTERRVAQKWFRDDLAENPACVARITIPGAQLVAYNRTEKNQVVVDLPNGAGGTAPTFVDGAACVTTTFDVTWAAPALQFSAGGKDVGLQPSAGVIKLLVGNMIAEDYNHPPQAPAGAMMSHYSAFYKLLVGPDATNQPSPHLPVPSGSKSGGVNPVICMTGSGCGENDATC